MLVAEGDQDVLDSIVEAERPEGRQAGADGRGTVALGRVGVEGAVLPVGRQHLAALGVGQAGAEIAVEGREPAKGCLEPLRCQVSIALEQLAEDGLEPVSELLG